VADVLAGGGMGRTPLVGAIVRRGLPWRHLATYSEALLRTYNLHGRRDNMYKSRIKILVRALGAEEFARQVDAEFEHLREGPGTFTDDERARVIGRFTAPAYQALADDPPALREAISGRPGFARWHQRNVRAHRQPGYAAVTLSLKPVGVAPGDLDADRMDAVAGLAERFSGGELRVTHEQNLVLAEVAQHDLPALWEKLVALGLATPNIGLLGDVICCPGGDFCALANAKSIPIAQALQERFEDLDYQHDLHELTLNISGCINSCGHHHVGNIGILGVDKQGAEFYQVTLGGQVGAGPSTTRIGTVLGRSFSAAELPVAVATVLDIYCALRDPGEHFNDTLERVGIGPFRSAVYMEQEQPAEAENA